MNFPSKLLALLLVLGSSVAAAKEATMIFSCTSVRLLPATVRQLGFDYRLSVTTTDDGSVNDELHAAADDSLSPHTHFSGLRLQLPPDPVFPDEPNLFVAALELDVPDLEKITDRNAISDLLEVSKAVESVTSAGKITYDDGMEIISGTVTATWSKEAGSTTGLCRLQLKVPDLALNLTFNHTFEIFDYRGTLTYENVGTNVNATVNLQRQGAEGSFKGPLQLGIVDRDELTYQSAPWTGPGGLQFGALGTDAPLGAGFTVLRGGLNTNYFGLLYFADGDPATPFLDEYDLWQIDIYDGNDSDGDRLPDFSDPPGTVAPAAPVVALRTVGGGLKLTITAQAGQPVVVEQQPVLGAVAWEQIDARTLAAATEELDLPLPAEGLRFYRVRAP